MSALALDKSSEVVFDMAHILAVIASISLCALGILVLPVWLPFTGLPLIMVCLGFCVLINSNALDVQRKQLRAWFRVAVVADILVVDALFAAMSLLLLIGNGGYFMQALLTFSIAAVLGIALTLRIPKSRTVRELMDAARSRGKVNQA